MGHPAAGSRPRGSPAPRGARARCTPAAGRRSPPPHRRGPGRRPPRTGPRPLDLPLRIPPGLSREALRQAVLGVDEGRAGVSRELVLMAEYDRPGGARLLAEPAED